MLVLLGLLKSMTPCSNLFRWAFFVFSWPIVHFHQPNFLFKCTISIFSILTSKCQKILYRCILCSWPTRIWSFVVCCQRYLASWTCMQYNLKIEAPTLKKLNACPRIYTESSITSSLNVSHHARVYVCVCKKINAITFAPVSLGSTSWGTWGF